MSSFLFSSVYCGIARVVQAAEKRTFQHSWKSPDGQSQILTRANYKEIMQICKAERRRVRKNKGYGNIPGESPVEHPR
jgi:hypothetical protein